MNKNKFNKNAQCPVCASVKDLEALKDELFCCPDCGHHFSMPLEERIKYIADENSFIEDRPDTAEERRLDFRGKNRIVSGVCKIHGKDVILGVLLLNIDAEWIENAINEKIRFLLLKGARERLPVIIYAAEKSETREENPVEVRKNNEAAAEIDKAQVPYFIVLCNPAYGNISISFALMADLIIAEPGARIGFQSKKRFKKHFSKRSFEGSIKENAEFHLQSGFIDLILPRNRQKAAISMLLEQHGP